MKPQGNIHLLMVMQALAGAVGPIMISLAGLVGLQLAHDPALATLPVAGYNIGVAVAMLPVAWLLARLGRRVTYLLGALLCSGAGLLAAAAIVSEQFWLFAAAAAVAGFYTACAQNYRFAAADLAAPGQQPRAISKVMLGGLAAAVIGPQLVIYSQAALPGAPYAGSFIALAGLALLAVPIIARLQVPPTAATDSAAPGRPLLAIVRTPVFLVGALCGVCSYGLMAFVMTAAPLAMVGHGHAVNDATLGIQWHVLAMFVPSFFSGRWIERYGKVPITGLGLLLLAAAGLAALSGLQVVHFWGSLVLLGLGWNLSFVGATAIIAGSYRPAERAKVQAANDFLVFATVAVASLSAGYLLAENSWQQLNQIILPVVAAVVLVLVSCRRAVAASAGESLRTVVGED